MTKSQAKKLKAGDRVIWRGKDDLGMEGTVTRKHYKTVWIQWEDGGPEWTHYAETMDNIWTSKQLEDIEVQKRIVEKIQALKPEERSKKVWEC